MSMTREEAIKELETIKMCEVDTVRQIQALDVALSALRPVSREQVEKVWRGEWNNINPVVLKPGVPWVCRCAKCGCLQDYRHNFCPNCGEAKMDGAVQMVIERINKMEGMENEPY